MTGKKSHLAKDHKARGGGGEAADFIQKLCHLRTGEGFPHIQQKTVLVHYGKGFVGR